MVPAGGYSASMRWLCIVSVFYARSQYRLGRCYQDGIGVPVDAQLAFRWYEAAVAQGFVHAQYSLGWCYENWSLSQC
jgi:TPR repeat protein